MPTFFHHYDISSRHLCSKLADISLEFLLQHLQLIFGGCTAILIKILILKGGRELLGPRETDHTLGLSNTASTLGIFI